jgi:hypothetical protein
MISEIIIGITLIIQKLKKLIKPILKKVLQNMKVLRILLIIEQLIIIKI